MPAAQEIIFQNFRQREIKKFPVQDRFHFRIAALHRVADHDHIGGRGDIVRLDNPDVTRIPRSAQKRGHRRIDAFIGAGDAETALFQRRGHRPHRRPADAEKVKITRLGTPTAFLTRERPIGERHGTPKPQAPNSKETSNHQASITACTGSASFWLLELGYSWCLKFGAWCFRRIGRCVDPTTSIYFF